MLRQVKRYSTELLQYGGSRTSDGCAKLMDFCEQYFLKSLNGLHLQEKNHKNTWFQANRNIESISSINNNKKRETLKRTTVWK